MLILATQCDETKPSCLNCAKLGRDCPGYPDQLDLFFKNETATVTRKATRGSRSSTNKRPNRPKASASSVASAGSTGSDDVTLQATEPGPSWDSLVNQGVDANNEYPDNDLDWMDAWEPFSHMMTDLAIENQPRPFYFTDLTLQPHPFESTRHSLDALLQDFHVADDRPPFYIITEAIALRSIATYPGSDRLIRHADRLCGAALQIVARTTPRAESEDSVREAVMSSLLFALYECLAAGAPLSAFQQAQSKINPLRADEPLPRPDPSTLPLYPAAEAHVFANDAQRQAYLDRLAVAERWMKNQSGKSPDRRFADYPVQMPNVLAKATALLSSPENRTLDAAQEVEGLLHEAYDLQTELYSWDMNMPPQFGYRSDVHTATTQNAALLVQTEIWPGPVHVYNEVHDASIRNNNRVSQLLCANVVLKALKWLDPAGYTEDRRYKAATFRIQYLVDDIAASVPFHFGYDSSRSSNKASSIRRSSHESDAESSAAAADSRLSGGYFLIWPLYVASQMASIPSLQRRWLSVRLNTIIQHYGLERSDASAFQPSSDAVGPVR